MLFFIFQLPISTFAQAFEAAISTMGIAGNNKVSFLNSPYLRLIISVLWIVFLLLLSRALMFVFNPRLFGYISSNEYMAILFHGLRFDLSAALFINSIFLLISLMLIFIPSAKTLRCLNFIIFYCIPNSIAVGLNLTDVIYYRFTLKRMTADIFSYLGHAGDMGALLPQFMRDFWYITLITIAFILALVWVARRILKQTNQPPKGIVSVAIHSSITLLIVFFSVIGMRGGFQLKPIGIAQASIYVQGYQTALLLNTPFTILKTVNKTHLVEINYYDNPKEMESVFSPMQHPLPGNNDYPTLPGSEPNIVIILLESFSTEHISSLCRGISKPDYKGFTPFLDSLISHSLVFDGYANGKRSIESVPAILSSLPSLMNNDFISSVYSNNRVQSLAAILREKGYETMFFHGGTNGTMGFDTYATSTGFNKYFGRREFNDDSHFDGKWGIFDEPFLKFVANTLNTSPNPFFSFVFTLSSHHPYIIPAAYAGKLRAGNLPIHQAISYADEALKQFFKTASSMPWFNNTLFILTSDHTSEPVFPFYKSYAGSLSVPMIFYHPEVDLHRKETRIMQHIDILPTVLHLTGYQKSFMAFGHSAFNKEKPGFSITFLNNRYQLIKDGYLFHFDGEQAIGLYDFRKDLLCKSNILDSEPELAANLTRFVKAYIQQYNYGMIHNNLAI